MLWTAAGRYSPLGHSAHFGGCKPFFSLIVLRSSLSHHILLTQSFVRLVGYEVSFGPWTVILGVFAKEAYLPLPVKERLSSLIYFPGRINACFEPTTQKWKTEVPLRR